MSGEVGWQMLPGISLMVGVFLLVLGACIVSGPAVLLWTLAADRWRRLAKYDAVMLTVLRVAGGIGFLLILDWRYGDS